MRASQAEATYYPNQRLHPEEFSRVLCVAPHPDDEILGCGGLLALLADSRCQIEVIILTQGERAQGAPSNAHALTRVQESCTAASRLGLPEPRFLDWPDRGVGYSQPLIDTLAAAIAQSQAQCVLLPSLSEPHPDHQSVALAGIAAVQRNAQPVTLLFYEVGAPMHPNAVLDITTVSDRKWSALQAFQSQEAIQPYTQHARAFAALRAFCLGPHCTAAEAYFRVESSALRNGGMAMAMPYWPLVRARQELANQPQQLPLVSVLIRSMDRPQLIDAIGSVVAQTYSNIEVVVVNASGRPHSIVHYPHYALKLRIVEPGLLNTPLSRAQAANAALVAGEGEFALFLDDDDSIAPEHIERLVTRLLGAPRAVAAYSGANVIDHNGAILRSYDLPWASERIQGINFLPIHAVLFSLKRVKQSTQKFDETLPVLEDWEYWHTLAQSGDFVHCPGVTAFYRQHYGTSNIGDEQHEHHWKKWHLLLSRRYVQNRSPEQNAAVLAWHAIELDKATALNDSLSRQLATRQTAAQNEELSRLLLQVNQLVQTIDQLSSERGAAIVDRDAIAAHRNQLVQAIDQLSSERGTAIADRDAIAAHRNQLVQTIDQLSSERGALITDRDAIATHRNQLVQTIDQLSSERGTAIADRDAIAAQREILVTDMESCKAENALLRQEIDRIKASRSWRFTAPLRRPQNQ